MSGCATGPIVSFIGMVQHALRPSLSRSEFQLNHLFAKMDAADSDKKILISRTKSSDVLVKLKEPFVEKQASVEAEKKSTESSIEPLKTATISHRIYGKVVFSLENCILPKDRLLTTPSANEGLDLRTEWFLRRIGCDIIQHAGVILKLPQVNKISSQFFISFNDLE